MGGGGVSFTQRGQKLNRVGTGTFLVLRIDNSGYGAFCSGCKHVDFFYSLNIYLTMIDTAEKPRFQLF